MGNLITIKDASVRFFKEKKVMKSSRNEFIALRNISCQICEGDKIALIGKNGAGKSTLLSIVAGIMQPSTGSVTRSTDSISLLSVNAGHFPYLSGRKNVLLHGLLLGLTKKQIQEKMDEIIEFSGLKDFIDDPVETYSSGMKSRLGFSAALFSSPKILLIDETLSVGDAEFQKKCISTIEKKLVDSTYIIASHSRKSTDNICNKSLYLHKGKIEFFGEYNEGYDKYEGK
ncbi:MAG: ABC transporter ATP-binding protein [Bdellovibrionales bacterium]|nr:ABC transporter ATP-binding protein [Bdellovibrionales bacterium]